MRRFIEPPAHPRRPPFPPAELKTHIGLTKPGSVHCMGSWKKLINDYLPHMIVTAWMKTMQ